MCCACMCHLIPNYYDKQILRPCLQAIVAIQPWYLIINKIIINTHGIHTHTCTTFFYPLFSRNLTRKLSASLTSALVKIRLKSNQIYFPALLVFLEYSS